MPISTPEGQFEPFPLPPQGAEQRTANLLDKTQEVLRALENYAEPDHEQAIFEFDYDIFGQEALKTILPVHLSNYLASQQGRITMRGIEIAFDSTAGAVQRSDLAVIFILEDLASGLSQEIIATKPDNFTAADPFDIAHVSDDGTIIDVHHQSYAANEISRLVTCLALRERDWDSVRYAKNVLDPQDKQTMLLLKNQLTMHSTRYSLDTKYEYVLDTGGVLLRVNHIKSEDNTALYEIELVKTYTIDHKVYGRNISNIKTTAMLIDEAPTEEGRTPSFSISHQLLKETGEALTKNKPRTLPGSQKLEAIFKHYLEKAVVSLSKTRPNDMSYETSYLNELNDTEEE